jgi:MoaA/NifB/PqqE/SkfB family radical SAM enzyme
MRLNNFWCYRRILFSRGFASAVWNSRKNVVAYHQKRPLKAGPYMAELDITYRCNCRCQMCQRWNDPRRGELSFEEYTKLADDLHAMGSHQISISGGEPLLRGDVFQIIESFAQRGMSVNLCTNGLLLKKYRDEVRSSGMTCVTISLDGATAASHDKIRGIPGSYKQIEEGIEHLLKTPRSSRPILRVRMTVSNHNAREIGPFYERWHTIADDVLLQPVHRCTDAFYTGMDESDLKIDPEIIARQVVDTPFANDNYIKRLINSLKTSNSFPHQNCYAGVLMARIDPWGNVYPCLEQHVRIGSVRENDFQTIWNSDNFDKERKRLASNRPCSCWYNNTALIGHYGNLLGSTPGKAVKDLAQNTFWDNLPSVFSEKK